MRDVEFDHFCRYEPIERLKQIKLHLQIKETEKYDFYVRKFEGKETLYTCCVELCNEYLILSGNRYENVYNVSFMAMSNEIPVFWYTTKRLSKGQISLQGHPQ